MTVFIIILLKQLKSKMFRIKTLFVRRVTGAFLPLVSLNFKIFAKNDLLRLKQGTYYTQGSSTTKSILLK